MRILKTSIFLLIISGFLFNRATLSDEEGFPKIGFIRDDGANVRAGDSINFESLCRLKKGDPVKVIGERYSWFKILLPKSACLYIKSDYIEFNNERSSIGTVRAMHVNLRAGPDTKYSIIGQISEPEKINIISEENWWYKIEPPVGTVGWVHSDLITFDLELINLSGAERDEAGVLQDDINKEKGKTETAPAASAPTKKKEKGSIILKPRIQDSQGNLTFSTQTNR